MTKCINGICIEAGQLLVACKKGVWILPGGKPLPAESDNECLIREVREELGVTAKISDYYKSFTGKTPFTKDDLIVETYFIELDGQLKPQAEISAIKWINASCSDLSEATEKIIRSLCCDNLLEI